MARLNTRPLIGGAVIGAVAAIAIVLLPSTAIESIVLRTHLADVLTAAQPPLGTKARLMLALIPLLMMTAVGLVIGIIVGRQRSGDDDFGSYPVYDLGAPPAADPFAAPAPVFTPQPEPEPAPVEATPAIQPAPAPPPVARAAAPQPTVSTPPLDSATAADLAEIADAIVRLDARVEAIEARLDATPPATGTGAGVVPAGLAERLQKIARALDDAG